MLDEQATAEAVIGAIAGTAHSLRSGDMLLLTYSGHGSQVPDKNSDESDGQDETWCLYDRMLVDDELNALWSQFKSGVRICMLSDSCHSDTVARVALLDGTVADDARSADKFYATWQDSELQTGSTYDLPDEVWQRLRPISALYYRVGTTTSESGWENYRVSVDDSDVSDAPFVEVSYG